MSTTPIVTETVPWTEFAEVPRFGCRYRHLSQAALGEGYHVGVAIEELPPGMQSAPAHYHFLEEEHVYILEGSLQVRLGAETHRMTAGDYICFPAGQRAGHCLINDGGAPCRYVIVGERNPNDVIVYPDSNKVMVRPLGKGVLLDLAARRGYWDGEATGLPEGDTMPASPPAPEAPVRPKPPLAAHSVVAKLQSIGRDFGGGFQHLTQAAVGADWHVGVVIESPAPGKRLWPKHYHMLEEEHVLLLEGEATLLLGDARYPMRPGDYVGFPAGQALGHAILNSGEGPCRYLLIGERNPNEVCVYPDSNKLAVDALRAEERIFDKAATRGYWDGEA
jgi:uncharacterized cupin superfamily protein